ncbi:hypothetical protein [Nitrospira sp. M1]
MEEERCAYFDASLEEDRIIRTFCYTLHDKGVRIPKALVLQPSKVDLSEKAIIIRLLKKCEKILWQAIPVSASYPDILELAHVILLQISKGIRPFSGGV